MLVIRSTLIGFLLGLVAFGLAMLIGSGLGAGGPHLQDLVHVIALWLGTSALSVCTLSGLVVGIARQVSSRRHPHLARQAF